MKNTRWVKGVALMLCAGLLLGLCGCGGDGNEPVATTTTTSTTATTMATTSTTATTTTKEPTTTTELTTTTAKPTTTTTTTTTAPTTTAAPVETDLQIGGKYFTIDGLTFEMGTSPDKLLAHLGEPNKTNSMADSRVDATATQYYYDDVLVNTITPTGTTNEIIAEVYFISNRYSFDGVAVEDTVEKLDQRVTAKLEPKTRCDYRSGLIGGPSYWYDKDSDDLVKWMIFFPKEDEIVNAFNQNDNRVPSNTQIACIKIRYLYEY